MNYMMRAIVLAEQALSNDEVPVGAVLVNNDKIISQAHNTCEANKNSLQHAEMLVIQQAIENLRTPYLDTCILYVTLEPCPLCAAAIAQARVAKVVFGAYDPKSGGIEHGPQIFKHSHFCPQVIGGVLESQCSELLKNFFRKKR